MRIIKFFGIYSRRLPWLAILGFFVFLGAMVWIAPPTISVLHRGIFLGYAVFVFGVIWRAVRNSPFSNEQKMVPRRFFFWLLIGAALFFLFSRFILFVRFGEAPLGYDTGFYLKSVETAMQTLEGHRPFRAFLWVQFLLLGVRPIYVLHGLYVLFQFLIIGGFYMLGRTMRPDARLSFTAVLLFLYVTSLPQFFAYWWIFYQMELSVAALLITLYLIHRRSTLSLLTGGFGVALHPATFLPFAIALFLFAALALGRSLLKRVPLHREATFILVLGLVAFVVVNLFGQEFMQIYLRGSVNQYGWFLTNYPDHIRQQLTGLFINLNLFRLTNLYMLPFAISGIILWITRRLRSIHPDSRARLLVFATLIAVTFTFAYLPFIYQNRFLIILDLGLIVFAAYALLIFFRILLPYRFGKAVVALLIVGLTSYAGYAVLKQQPQLYPDERGELQTLAKRAGDVAVYAMSTESLYTPWVYAFSGMTTIDPGYLSWNLWNYPMWREFWYGKSDARRHELLAMYDRPLYIFVGKRVPDTVRYKQFIREDSHFVRMSPHIWYYDPRVVTKGEIQALYEHEREQ